MRNDNSMYGWFLVSASIAFAPSATADAFEFDLPVPLSIGDSAGVAASLTSESGGHLLVATLPNAGELAVFGVGLDHAMADIPPASTPLGVANAAAGDIDNDGDGDLILVHPSLKQISIVQQATGTLIHASNASTEGVPTAADLADIDGDGDLDIAATQTDIAAAVLFLNRGDGTFDRQDPFPAGPAPNGIALGDIDGDNRPDLAIANEFCGHITIRLNRGEGFINIDQTLTAQNRPRSLLLEDLNGDGRADLVAVNTSSGSISIAIASQTTGLLGPFSHIHVGLQPEHLASADFDRDGRTDLAVSLRGENAVAILRQTENATFESQKLDLPARSIGVATAELGGGDAPDLFLTSPNAVHGYIAVNKTASRGPRCPGDTNGDLFVDVTDFFTVVQQFGMVSDIAAGNPPADADLDRDGIVDADDFFIVINNYGLVCGEN